VALRSSEFKLKSRRNGTGYPHLFRFELELASAPRCRGHYILLLIIVRSFLALKIKPKRIEKRIRFFDISFENAVAVSQACRQLDAPERSPLWLWRFDRITNQESVRHGSRVRAMQSYRLSPLITDH
jgi:hypothetical protein